MLAHNDLMSIIESVLFAVQRPLSLRDFSRLFYGEKVSVKDIQKALGDLTKRYELHSSGIILQEVAGAWQIRTKEENKHYIRRLVKGRGFYLSNPAMEVLSIVAYRQPVSKMSIDNVRGVESGHLLRTLIEKDLVCFGPKSDLPGKPATYKTTARFLEVFGLKSLKELPSSDDIADLMPSADTDLALNNDEALTSSLQVAKNWSDLESQKRVIDKEWQTVSEKIQSVPTTTPVIKELNK